MNESREPIPEIVLQANNRRVYDQLLAALASAESENPGRDDQLQGYREVRNQQLPGAVQAAAVVQVLEVTGTTSDVAELVESAQNQGAVLLNAAVVEPQLPELGMQSQRKQEPKRVLTLERNPAAAEAAAAADDGPAGEEEIGRERHEVNSTILFRGVVNMWLQQEQPPPESSVPPAQQQLRANQAQMGEAMRWRIIITPQAVAKPPG